MSFPELCNAGKHRDIVIIPPAGLGQPVRGEEPETCVPDLLLELVLCLGNVPLLLPPLHKLRGGFGSNHAASETTMIPAFFHERFPCLESRVQNR